jgi:hypothetical protein
MTGKVTDSILKLELTDLEAATIVAALEVSEHKVAEKLSAHYSDKDTWAFSLVSNTIKKKKTARYDDTVIFVPDAP